MPIPPPPIPVLRRASIALAAVLSLCGCFSTTDIPESPDDVTVEIELSHSTRRESGGGRPLVTQQITAVLRDGKRKAIENDSLRMSVNGVPMPLSVSRGNYGEHHPRYHPPDGLLVHADSAYRFSLVWPDGTRHDVGTLRTPPPLTPAHFDVPKTHRGGPLAIRWSGLAGRAVLTASPSYETVDSAGNRGYEAGGAAADGSTRREIGPGTAGGASGSWVLPASLFVETPRRRTYAVIVEATATSEQRVPRLFARDSYLRARQTLEMWIDVPAPDSAGGGR
jgi:hypothetical protein